MRRLATAALLAAPLLLADGRTATAANPGSFGLGCWGFCLNLFPFLHQHGPLYNYGPYYGYPPFEPYGPWNAYLQYNPYYYQQPPSQGHGWNSCGHGRCGGCNFCGYLRGLAQHLHRPAKHGGCADAPATPISQETAARYPANPYPGDLGYGSARYVYPYLAASHYYGPYLTSPPKPEVVQVSYPAITPEPPTAKPNR